MELKSYLRVLRQNVALLIAAALVGALGGLGAGLLTPRAYTAQTQLFVSIPNTGNATDLQQGSAFTQERMQTYVDMANSRSVLRPVIAELDLDVTPDVLAKRVRASSDPQTVLISIEATDRSPAQSARIAEAVATSLVEVVTDLENPTGTGAAPVVISVAEAAEAPAHSSSMSLWVAVVLGVVAGLVFGVGAALLRSALDTRLRGREALRRITRAPVLTTVPADPTTARTPLVTDLPAHSIRGEAFRRLRTNLKYAQVGDSTSSVLVTSSVEGEGKTTSSINLAIVMAKAGKRVALVDADLRRPRVASMLGLENAAGITTALVGAAEVGDLLQAWGDDELYVLTAGEIPPNPTELLESQQMARIIAQLTAEFDLVVIDGPPLLPVADGLVLAQQVGRVILVAAVGQVRVAEVQEALGALALVDADRVGIVLNKVSAANGEIGAYGHAYARYAPDVEHGAAVRDDFGQELTVGREPDRDAGGRPGAGGREAGGGLGGGPRAEGLRPDGLRRASQFPGQAWAGEQGADDLDAGDLTAHGARGRVSGRLGAHAEEDEYESARLVRRGWQ